MDEIADLARFYKALGDGTRLHLVQLLARQCPGRMLCVGRLAEELGVTPSSISQHLRILKSLGLVVGQRQGYRIHYRLETDSLARYGDLARDQLGWTFVATVDTEDKEMETMCGCKDCGCQHPDKCEGSPEECSPEQIRECHGDGAEHPCECVEASEGEQA